MDRRYYRKTIKIDGCGVGTIAVMEWIRDNGCPDLSYTEFIDGRNNFVVMVSRGDEEMFSALLESIDKGVNSWLEYEGMKRYTGTCDYWVFLIDGVYYWATR